MKGLGTDDDTLVRIVASRCEVDMVQIKEEFQKEYKQSLGMFIAVSRVAIVKDNSWYSCILFVILKILEHVLMCVLKFGDSIF